MSLKRMSRLETLLQGMVEGSFGRLLGGQLQPLDVVSQLVRSMEDSTRRGEALPAFEVAMNPHDLASLEGDGAALEGALAEAAWELGRQAGIHLVARPRISIVPDTLVRRHTVQITTLSHEEIGQERVEETQVLMPRVLDEMVQEEIEALHAFLVVQGRRHYPLEKSVVTLGRRADNDIVLDLPSVSRQHAQIRWRFGRFILYDVSNRGRTLVNGVPVTEHVLQPGDAIALSAALLIYAEDGRSLPDLEAGTKTKLRPPAKYE